MNLEQLKRCNNHYLIRCNLMAVVLFIFVGIVFWRIINLWKKKLINIVLSLPLWQTFDFLEWLKQKWNEAMSWYWTLFSKWSLVLKLIRGRVFFIYRYINATMIRVHVPVATDRVGVPRKTTSHVTDQDVLADFRSNGKRLSNSFTGLNS